jgi:hypothetical protein
MAFVGFMGGIFYDDRVTVTIHDTLSWIIETTGLGMVGEVVPSDFHFFCHSIFSEAYAFTGMG